MGGGGRAGRMKKGRERLWDKTFSVCGLQEISRPGWMYQGPAEAFHLPTLRPWHIDLHHQGSEVANSPPETTSMFQAKIRPIGQSWLLERLCLFNCERKPFSEYTCLSISLVGLYLVTTTGWNWARKFQLSASEVKQGSKERGKQGRWPRMGVDSANLTQQNGV